MKKRTHLIFAFMLFLLFNRVFGFPLLDSVFALIGAMVPDLDLYPRSAHRKLFHNVWSLAGMVFVGMASNFMNSHIALLFSIGFVSHLISDSLTIQGVMWLWPIQKPHFSGSISTGGFKEYVVMMGMLFTIFVLFGVISINL